MSSQKAAESFANKFDAFVETLSVDECEHWIDWLTFGDMSEDIEEQLSNRIMKLCVAKEQKE